MNFCEPLFNDNCKQRRRRYWSQIHVRKISLRFRGIILRALRLEVYVYNVYVANQFRNHVCSRGWE